jgi:hypothetical protein
VEIYCDDSSNISEAELIDKIAREFGEADLEADAAFISRSNNPFHIDHLQV